MASWSIVTVKNASVAIADIVNIEDVQPLSRRDDDEMTTDELVAKYHPLLCEAFSLKENTEDARRIIDALVDETARHTRMEFHAGFTECCRTCGVGWNASPKHLDDVRVRTADMNRVLSGDAVPDTPFVQQILRRERMVRFVEAQMPETRESVKDVDITMMLRTLAHRAYPEDHYEHKRMIERLGAFLDELDEIEKQTVVELSQCD